MRNRINFLDGFRGVAIIAVIIFHAYVNDPTRLPFSDQFNVLPWRLGWQGVELFFLISGFVILMTLERTKGLLEFAWLRWARLFPTMLIASLIGFAIYRPPTLDLLPGLTFISPSLIHALTGLDLHNISGVFWSLYVEVAFYAVFGTIYFAAGPRYAIGSAFGLFLVSAILSKMAFPEGSLAWRFAAATRWIGFIYFGWLASGALFYQFFFGRSTGALALACASGIISVAMTEFPLTEKIGLALAVATFAASVYGLPFLQRSLSWRPLVFVGTISYPLYLVHLVIIDSMKWSAATALSFLPPILWPTPAIALSVGVAWLIHVSVEKPFTKAAHVRKRALAPILSPD